MSKQFYIRTIDPSTGKPGYMSKRKLVWNDVDGISLPVSERYINNEKNAQAELKSLQNDGYPNSYLESAPDLSEMTAEVQLTKKELMTILALDVGYELINKDSRLYDKLFRAAQELVDRERAQQEK